ncbi:MAG TPA: hypothetical protein VJ487_21410 [Alphaproteobacteria bacterium]|nr:hypothetical protein [Alphaproteobacteria bacterium]
MTVERIEVHTARELMQQPEEYQAAVRKIVISHAINELYGAEVFDEPAIAHAAGLGLELPAMDAA